MKKKKDKTKQKGVFFIKTPTIVRTYVYRNTFVLHGVETRGVLLTREDHQQYHHPTASNPQPPSSSPRYRPFPLPIWQYIYIYSRCCFSCSCPSSSTANTTTTAAAAAAVNHMDIDFHSMSCNEGLLVFLAPTRPIFPRRPLLYPSPLSLFFLYRSVYTNHRLMINISLLTILYKYHVDITTHIICCHGLLYSSYGERVGVASPPPSQQWTPPPIPLAGK